MTTILFSPSALAIVTEPSTFGDAVNTQRLTENTRGEDPTSQWIGNKRRGKVATGVMVKVCAVSAVCEDWHEQE
jgi:hypothetical protein